MPDQTVHCVVERAAKLSEPTRKTTLHEPLAYDNAYAHSMRYRAYNDDGTEANMTGYSVVGAFTPSGHNTIKPLLNGTASGNVTHTISRDANGNIVLTPYVEPEPEPEPVVEEPAESGETEGQ